MPRAIARRTAARQDQPVRHTRHDDQEIAVVKAGPRRRPAAGRTGAARSGRRLSTWRVSGRSRSRRRTRSVSRWRTTSRPPPACTVVPVSARPASSSWRRGCLAARRRWSSRRSATSPVGTDSSLQSAGLEQPDVGRDDVAHGAAGIDVAGHQRGDVHRGPPPVAQRPSRGGGCPNRGGLGGGASHARNSN